MWLYRRVLRIKWTDKRTNNSILEELSVERELLREINKRRLKYLGHANRNKNTSLMTTVLQGKIEAKRRPGRPPTTYIENIKKICHLNIQEVVQRSQDRKAWTRVVKSVIAAANIDTDEADR